MDKEQLYLTMTARKDSNYNSQILNVKKKKESLPNKIIFMNVPKEGSFIISESERLS